MNGLRLYGRFVGLSVRAQMQYRASFVLMSVGQFVVTGVEFLGVWALFRRFGDLVPWSLAEVAFFYGMVNAAFAVTDCIARGFDMFGAQFVKTGNFDRVLIRPRSTVLQVSGYDFPLMRVGRFAQGLLVLLWAASELAIPWDAWRVLFALTTFVSIVVFFYGLVVCQGVLSFWTTESLEVMNALTYGGVETAQYPMAIYQADFRRFFTYAVPLACVAYFPVVAILGVEDPLGSTRTFQVLAPLAGFLFFGFSLLLWRVGVRHYTSTGS